MKMNNLRSLLAAFAAFFIAGSAAAQTAGTVTNHAFAIGKGAGQAGFTSLLCASTQIAIGQSAANPACYSLSGDVTMSASGVTAIGAGKVTNTMLAGSIAASKLVGTDIATVGTITSGAWQATPVAVAYGGTGATTASNARTNLGVAIGTNVQAWDADLDCLAALSAGGIVARTGAGTCAARTVTAPAAGITVSNGDGVAGNPTLALANDLAAVEGLTGTGLARRTGTDTWSVGTTVAVSEGGTGGTSASGTLLDNITGFSGTGFLTRTGAGAYAFQSATNGVLNSNLVQAGSATIKGNPTGSTANVQDFTIQGLTARGAPDAANDKLVIYDNTAGTLKYITPSQIAGASSGTVTQVDTSAGLSGGPITTSGTISLDGAFGFRNRVINPNGQIWQRGNNGAAAITDGVYAFDRWYGLTQSAGVTASQVTNAENGTPYMMRLTQANATAQRFGLAQAIENSNIIDARGQAVTLSARVRMSAATTLRYAIVEWTGTADAITKDVVNDWTSSTYTPGNFFISTSTTITATGSVALSANTLTSISLTGTVSGSANNVIVFFWTDSAQAQNVTLDIGKVQLEMGASATPLALRDITEEIISCQRRYAKILSSSALYVAFGAGIAVDTTGIGSFYIKYPVRMANIPSITYGGTLAMWNGATFFNVTSIAAAYAGLDSVLFQPKASATFTVGAALNLVSNNSASTFIAFESEL